MNTKLDFMQIGNRIQHYRTQRKLTQDKLAEIIGTTQNICPVLNAVITALP